MSRYLVLSVLFFLPIVARGEDGFDGQSRCAAHDGSGAFATWGAESLAPGALQIGVAFDHARDPVVLQAGGDLVVPIVSRSTTVEAGVFYGLPLGLEAGISVPTALREVPNPLGLDGEGGVASNGMGDARAEVKWRALSPRGAVPGLAISAGSTLPTGDGRAWLGAGVAQPSVTLIVEERLGALRVLANAGYRVYTGKGESAWDVKQGDAIVYRGAAAYTLPFREVTLLAEALGSKTAGGGPNPLEAGMGVRAPLAKGIVASAGANVGLNDSIGTPAWRAFGAVSWSFGAGAKPRIPDRRPVLAETAPAPTPAATAEPMPAATPKPAPTAAPVVRPPDALGMARIDAREGLALYKKADYAGALARFDSAIKAEPLLVPSERVLLHKYIAFCHAASGRRDDAKASFRKALSLDPNLALAAGTVPPKTLEVFHEVRAESSPMPFVGRQDKDRIELDVRFENDRAEILAVSLPVLDALAKWLQQHPEIVLVRLEGYMDASGDAKKNLALSKARAKQVRDHLVRKGVAPVRVISEGYGPAKPIASNQTPEGRAKNRRIELKVLARKK